jgi:hypothetical protein
MTPLCCFCCCLSVIVWVLMVVCCCFLMRCLHSPLIAESAAPTPTEIIDSVGMSIMNSAHRMILLEHLYLRTCFRYGEDEENEERGAANEEQQSKPRPDEENNNRNQKNDNDVNSDTRTTPIHELVSTSQDCIIRGDDDIEEATRIRQVTSNEDGIVSYATSQQPRQQVQRKELCGCCKKPFGKLLIHRQSSEQQIKSSRVVVVVVPDVVGFTFFYFPIYLSSCCCLVLAKPMTIW